MLTEQEFKNWYDENLKKQVDSEWETFEKTEIVQSQSKIVLIGVFMVLAVLVIFFSHHIFYVLIGIAVFISIYIGYQQDKQKKFLSETVFDPWMNLVLSTFGDVKFDKNIFINHDTLYASQVVNNVEMSSIIDKAEGYVNNFHIKSCILKVSDEDDKNTTNTFFICAPSKKDISTDILIYSKKDFWDSGSNRPSEKDGYRKIDFEDPGFKGQFTVYSQNADEAKQILDTKLREKLLYIKQNLSAEPDLSYTRGYFFAAFRVKNNLYDGFIKGNHNYEDFKYIFHLYKTAFNMMIELAG